MLETQLPSAALSKAKRKELDVQFVLLCMLPLYRGSLLSDMSQYAAAMPNSPLATHEVEMGAPGNGLMTPLSETGSPLQFAFAKVRTRSVIVPPPSPLPEPASGEGEGSAPSSCSARTSSGGRTAHANSASTSSRGARAADRSRGSQRSRPATMRGWRPISFWMCFILCFCVAPRPRRARDIRSRERRLQADRRARPPPFFMTAL